AWAIAMQTAADVCIYSLRNLFYSLREALTRAFGKEPDYGTFSDVITKIEREGGKIQGLYRDNRGSIYHPHLRQRIPLGDLTVRCYRRPPLTFNKILVIEKEGVFPMLIEIGWPEQHDCALVTSKGQGTGALKDLIDYLADSGEEIQVFCVHEADGGGTCIA